MRIAAIRLKGFGLFGSGLTLNLPPGKICVILGENESGKSTLVSAIFAVLFGLPSTDDERRFRSWQGSGQYAGSLELEANGARTAVSRDFGTNLVEIFRVTGEIRQRVFSEEVNPRARKRNTEYSRFLLETLGFEDPDLFTRTFLVKQQALETALDSQLRQLISGAAAGDYLDVLDGLKTDYDELSMRSRWAAPKRNEREIERIQRSLEEKKSRLRNLSETLERTAGLHKTKSELEKNLAELKRSLNEKKQFLDKLSAYVRLMEKKAPIEERMARMVAEDERAEELKARAESLREQLTARFGSLEGLQSRLSQPVPVALANFEQQEQEARRLETERDKETTARPTLPRHMVWAKIVAVLALLAGALILIIKGTGWLYASLLLAIVAAALLFAAWSVKRGVTQHWAQRLSALAEQIARVKQAAQSAREPFDELLRNQSIADLKAQWGGYERERGAVEDVEKELQFAQRNQPDKTERQRMQVDLMNVSAQITALEQEHLFLRNLAGDSSQIAQLEVRTKQEVQHIEAEMRATEERLSRLLVELGVLSHLSGNPETIEEEIEDLESALEQKELRRRALEAAVETLEEAAREFHVQHLTRLAGHVSDLFSQLTSGRYSSVLWPSIEETSGGTGGPVVCGFGKDAVALAEISQGARDQLFFALRLAVGEELSRGKALPLILDDPFINFDDRRFAATEKLLSVCDAIPQVIIFSHDQRYRDWRVPMIKL